MVGREAPRADLTRLIAGLRQGETGVLDRIVPVVFDELKRIARSQLRNEAQGHTLQTTALVNEAYLRLARERRISAKDRVEFFGVASHAMRRVLVDYARKRKAAKRGGGAEHVALDAVEEFMGEREADEVLALDRALDALNELSPRAASVVQHRYFAGLTTSESADLLGVSTKTVDREWLAARAWLLREVARRVELLQNL